EADAEPGERRGAGAHGDRGEVAAGEPCVGERAVDEQGENLGVAARVGADAAGEYGAGAARLVVFAEERDAGAVRGVQAQEHDRQCIPARVAYRSASAVRSTSAQRGPSPRTVALRGRSSPPRG